jgi:hypothetical protein
MAVTVTATTMTTAMMSTSVMTAAAATAVTATMAAFGDRKVRHGQRRGENNGGYSQSEF